MRSLLNIPIWMLALLLAGSVAGSWIMLHRQAHRLEVIRHDLQDGQRLARDLRGVNDLFQAHLQTDALLDTPLSQTAPRVLAAIQDGAAKGVQIAAVSNRQGGPVSVETLLAQAVPGTATVRRARVRVSGEYRYYQGLVDYLGRLEQVAPVAIDSLHIDQHHLSFGLDIYGT